MRENQTIIQCDVCDPCQVPASLRRGVHHRLRRVYITRMARKPRRTYQPRIVGGKVMMPADLRRLHKELLEFERIASISDEMRAVIEDEWPELTHKLPPKKPHG